MTLKVILDVDTGIDDALAIMYAVAQPQIEVLAITCVGGNASVADVVNNSLGVLELMDAPTIPVASGAREPLIEPSRSAQWLHGSNGLADIELSVGDRKPDACTAVELIRDTVLASPEPVTIIATAPLTNVALFLNSYPQLADRIARIVFMGGSAGRGNATAVAEFNVWHDPEAAQIVIASGVPTVMYGLDVFEAIVVPDATIAALAARSDARGQLLGKIIGHTVQEPGTDRWYTNRLIGDAGAVCAALHPELFEFESWPVQVALAPGITRGQTVVDRRDVAGEDSVHGNLEGWSTVQIAMKAKPQDVLQEFFGTVLPDFDPGFR